MAKNYSFALWPMEVSPQTLHRNFCKHLWINLCLRITLYAFATLLRQIPLHNTSTAQWISQDSILNLSYTWHWWSVSSPSHKLINWAFIIAVTSWSLLDRLLRKESVHTHSFIISVMISLFENVLPLFLLLWYLSKCIQLRPNIKIHSRLSLNRLCRPNSLKAESVSLYV